MNLIKECAGAKSIGISAHVRPDGDAVGSSLALYLYLKKTCPDADIKLFLEPAPDSLGHLPLELIDSSYCYEGTFDVYFALDAAADRIGDAEAFFASAKKKINIDHHISNAAGCGDVNMVNPKAGSTAEVLFALMEEDMLDMDIAMALYTAMIHDTGVFQYSNTSPETLQIAAKLIGFGFNFPRIIEESFYQKSFLQNQIMGKVLTESVRFLDDRCVYGSVDRATMDAFGAKKSDFEGIVNQLKNTKGIDCAIFMYEMEDGMYKVSMRSNENVNVSEIASCFGGGGHVRAAGVTMNGSVEEIIAQLKEKIQEQY